MLVQKVKVLERDCLKVGKMKNGEIELCIQKSGENTSCMVFFAYNA